MGSHRLATIVAALLLGLLAIPALAQASAADVIRDCNEDGVLDGRYSQRELRDALNNLPSDIAQYGDCQDAIRQAQNDGARGRGGTGSAGGSGTGNGRGGSPKPRFGDPTLETKSGAYAANKDDKSALDRAVADAARGGALPGGLAIPAAGDFEPAKAGGLPLPLLLALIAVGLLIAATSVLVARKRLPALTRVTSRFRRS